LAEKVAKPDERANDKGMMRFLMIETEYEDPNTMILFLLLHFIPVIGNGERQSVIKDVTCQIIHVPKSQEHDRLGFREKIDSNYHYNIEQ
jgi:hypothetical protein